ncbi:MAG: type II secretion system F family protein [Clostridiales bacterium]|nr:type II secretion system F family protein [Clostridiales bacterium]
MRSFAGRTKKRGGPYHTRLPPGWIIRQTVLGILLSAGAAFVFYRSAWAMILGIFIVPLYIKKSRKRWMQTRLQNLQQQFISAMQMVSGSLSAGYSMENAWKIAEKEMISLYGENAEFCMDLRYMNQRMAMNESLERILSEYAAQSEVEDICQFAEVFSYAKRSGGDLTEIIRSVTGRMQQKAEILSEIETAVASKKMEQGMMNLLLPGVLLFVTISSPSYVSTLYHNTLGILVMSICLGGYLCCMFWSERLTDISV